MPKAKTLAKYMHNPQTIAAISCISEEITGLQNERRLRNKGNKNQIATLITTVAAIVFMTKAGNPASLKSRLARRAILSSMKHPAREHITVDALSPTCRHSSGSENTAITFKMKFKSTVLSVTFNGVFMSF